MTVSETVAEEEGGEHDNYGNVEYCPSDVDQISLSSKAESDQVEQSASSTKKLPGMNEIDGGK